MLACSRDCKQWCGQGARHWSCRAHERELWDEGCSGCVLQCVSVCLITEIQAVAAYTPCLLPRWWFSSCCLVHIAGARLRSHTTLHQRCRHDSPSPGSNVSQSPSTLTLLQLDQPHASCAHGPSPRSSPPQALATSAHGASLHPGAMCNPQCLPCRPVQERPTCAFHAAPMDQCVTKDSRLL